MAAITPVLTSVAVRGGSIMRYHGTGTANQSDTLTSPVCPAHASQRIRHVIVVYSDTPTQTGVIITLDSGISSAHDAVLLTGSADVRYTLWQPDEDLWLLPGDAIIVSAPAAGGVITASISIALEQDGL